MNAVASSSSQSRGNTYLDPNGTDSDPIIDQPQLNSEALDVEKSIPFLQLKCDATQPHPPESEKITLEARLAKKDKQLKAARQELVRVTGEKTRLKQEVVSTRHKLN